MNPLKIIQKYYDIESESYKILIIHSKAVTKKALEIAKKANHLNPNVSFIKETGMLHDIGIFLTNAPDIGCHGKKPYICHGVLGSEILKKEGFPQHALVCERHTGIGLSLQDIKKQKLPLPKRNMLPTSIEEKIICLGDKFFSKNPKSLTQEKTLQKIRKELSKFGKENIKIFDNWITEFKY